VDTAKLMSTTVDEYVLVEKWLLIVDRKVRNEANGEEWESKASFVAVASN